MICLPKSLDAWLRNHRKNSLNWKFTNVLLQQSIVTATYCYTAVLGNHVPHFIPHVDQPNRFPSPTYKNHLFSTITSPSPQSHTSTSYSGANFSNWSKTSTFRTVEEKRTFVLFVNFLIIKSSHSLMLYNHWKTPVPKSLFHQSCRKPSLQHLLKKTLRHWCFCVNFAKFLNISFLQKISFYRTYPWD